jgi:hypothetical protein
MKPQLAMPVELVRMATELDLYFCVSLKIIMRHIEACLYILQISYAIYLTEILDHNIISYHRTLFSKGNLKG